MTDQEFVLSIYPKAKIYHLPAPLFTARVTGFLIMADETMKFDRSKYGYPGHGDGPINENLCLMEGGLSDTEELAWKSAASFIRNQMLEKFES